MPTRNVVLTDHQAQMVENWVSSGRYQNASEVLREGLRLIERREQEDELRLSALRHAAHTGLADIESGAFRSFNSAQDMKHHLSSIRNKVMGA